MESTKGKSRNPQHYRSFFYPSEEFAFDIWLVVFVMLNSGLVISFDFCLLRFDF